MKKAICILCIKPDIKQIHFYKHLTSAYDVYFVCDNLKNTSTILEGIHFINIDPSISLINGFINSNTAIFPKTPIAWDKALYYFSSVNTSYDNVWFIEEDVLVPSLKTVPYIDSKYGIEDLLVASHISYEDEPLWLHWKQAINLTKPHYKSMVCAIRVSKRLLECIKEYANKNKTLYFIELLFNTLAAQNGLTIKKIPELSTITHKDKFEKSEIIDTNLYHPFKDLNVQETIHKMFM